MRKRHTVFQKPFFDKDDLGLFACHQGEDSRSEHGMVVLVETVKMTFLPEKGQDLPVQGEVLETPATRTDLVEAEKVREGLTRKKERLTIETINHGKHRLHVYGSRRRCVFLFGQYSFASVFPSSKASMLKAMASSSFSPGKRRMSPKWSIISKRGWMMSWL